jgi:predicted nuclease of predicted toxin-antitoxin system
MKFYTDENFPKITIEELRNSGHDILTAFEDGRANQAISDDDVFIRANELGRTILTLNRKDFKRLHFQHSNHFGIVICREDTDFIGQAQRINAKLEELENLEGELIRVYRPAK